MSEDDDLPMVLCGADHCSSHPPPAPILEKIGNCQTHDRLTTQLNYPLSCAQHPDLVEKRRKAFGDNLRTYLVAAQSGKEAPLSDSPHQGVNGVIPEDGPVAEDGDGAEQQQHGDGYRLRRRGTAPP